MKQPTAVQVEDTILKLYKAQNKIQTCIEVPNVAKWPQISPGEDPKTEESCWSHLEENRKKSREETESQQLEKEKENKWEKKKWKDEENRSTNKYVSLSHQVTSPATFQSTCQK